jgi:hypothetical protein
MHAFRLHAIVLLTGAALACSEPASEPQAGPKGYRDYLAEANAVVTTLSVEEAIGLLGDSSVVFVDVREQNELDGAGQIPGAIHVLHRFDQLDAPGGVQLGQADRVLLRRGRAFGAGREARDGHGDPKRRPRGWWLQGLDRCRRTHCTARGGFRRLANDARRERASHGPAA